MRNWIIAFVVVVAAAGVAPWLHRPRPPRARHARARHGELWELQLTPFGNHREKACEPLRLGGLFWFLEGVFGRSASIVRQSRQQG